VLNTALERVPEGERGTGVHPKIVQERLGHATIAVTLDIYSHVLPGMQEAAAVRFDESFQEAQYNS